MRHRLEQARAQLSDQEMERFAESVATQERSATAAMSSSADEIASSALVGKTGVPAFWVCAAAME